MFINFSNHPSDKWNPEQIAEAQKYGEIIDYRFPDVDCLWDDDRIRQEIERCSEEITAMSPKAVLCQGEFVLTFGVVRYLMEKGITCVSACSRRVSEEMVLSDGSVKKKSVFKFEKFRKYQIIE